MAFQIQARPGLVIVPPEKGELGWEELLSTACFPLKGVAQNVCLQKRLHTPKGFAAVTKLQVMLLIDLLVV